MKFQVIEVDLVARLKNYSNLKKQRRKQLTSVNSICPETLLLKLVIAT